MIMWANFVLAKQNKLAEAEAEYKLAETYFRKHLIPQPMSPYYHHRLGVALEGLNKLPESEREYREALRLDSESTDYQESLQRVLKAQGKTP
jgi:Flp pilus assembly protein TadD